MQPLPDRSGSDSGSDTRSESTPFKTVIGWKSKSDSQDDHQKIIRVANSKLTLAQAFQRYKFILEPTYSSTGWTFKATCPFPDHNDSTPSFGYNPEMDAFNCFGCHRSGKVVDFIAAMEGKSKIVVAREILNAYGVTDLSVELIDSVDLGKIQDILFKYSEFILDFKRKHKFSPKAVKYAKAVNWSIDIFLRKNSNLMYLDIQNLESLIEKIEEQVELFEETK